MTAGLWLLAAALLAEFARFIAAAVRRFRAQDGPEFPGDPRKAARLSQNAFTSEEKAELRFGAGYGVRTALASAALVAATVHTLAGPVGPSSPASLIALAFLTLSFTGLAQLAFLAPAIAVVKRASLDGALPALGLTIAGGICASALSAGGFAFLAWLRPAIADPPPEPVSVERPPPAYARFAHADFSVEVPAAWERAGTKSLDRYYATFRAPGSELAYLDVRYCYSSWCEGAWAHEYAERGAVPGTRRIVKAGANSFEVATLDPSVRREVAVQAYRGYFVLGMSASRARLAELEAPFERLVETLELSVRPATDPYAASWPFRVFFMNDSERVPETSSVALSRLVGELRADATTRVRIMGYAAPSERDAEALATARARSVAAVLEVHYEVDPGRIEAGGQVLDGARPEAALSVVR